MMRITDLMIQKLKPADGAARQKTYFDETLKGFGIRVSMGGSKSFVLIYGKGRNTKTLGRYPDLSLAEARKKAKQVQGELASMTEPELAVYLSPNFNEARERFLDDAKSRLKPSSYDQYSRPLNKHFEFSKRVGEITRQDVMKAISALKGSVSAPRHAFVAIRTMLSWCVLHGLISTSPVPPLQFKVTSRSRILTDEELKAVWLRADEVGYPYGALVQLLILTGQRRGEIAGLHRSWLSKNLLTYPTGFCKNKREHTIPLGPLALSIISKIPKSSELLFPASRAHVRGNPTSTINGWPKYKRNFDQGLTDVAPYTLHDLRRTFSSQLAAQGTPIHVTEKLLNHVSGTLSGVAAVYNRYSYAAEMRGAIEAYETHLLTLI